MEGKKQYLKIEAQLLKEGFISSEEMAEAQKIRNEHAARSKKTLGFILLDKKKLSREQLMHLLSLPEIQARMGGKAVKKELITQDQLAECKELITKYGSSLSHILMDKGYLAETVRKELTHEQLNSVYLAKQAIKDHLIQESDLESALKLKAYQKSTCEILYERNLITLSELNHAFRKFSRDLKLGQILIQQGLISEENLATALNAQAKKKQTLGKILLENRWLAIEQLYFALSIQYNTPFQKLDGYVYSEKQKVALRNIVGQRYAFDNLILPLFQSGNNLTLGVSNPANIWSMHGLKSLYPELQMTCALITDEKFNQLYALLYGELLPARIDQRSILSKPAETEASAVVISSPDGQQALIRSFYQTYIAHTQKTGIKPAQDEESWFMEFIEESFQNVCGEYGCSSVQYRCDVKDSHTKILASPVP